MRMIDEFFGGRAALRERLVESLTAAREQQGKTRVELDRVCGFGGRGGLPGSGQYEENPDLLTGPVVSRALFALRLGIDTLLPVDWGRRKSRLKPVLAMMKAQGAGVGAAAGGGDVKNIPAAAQAQVYVILKALQEMDDEPRPADEPSHGPARPGASARGRASAPRRASTPHAPGRGPRNDGRKNSVVQGRRKGVR